MADNAYAWCQDCRRWIPSEKINYFDGHRVCKWCMEGTKPTKEYVHEPYHESIQCIYCDSYDTVEQAPEWRKFKCNTCDATFRI